MPSIPIDDESIPLCTKALSRTKMAPTEQIQKRDGNPIDNVLGMSLATVAIAAILIGIVAFINKQREAFSEGEENGEESNEITKEMLEEDALAAVAGGRNRKVKRGMKRHEKGLEVLDSEEFMEFLRERLAIVN